MATRVAIWIDCILRQLCNITRSENPMKLPTVGLALLSAAVFTLTACGQKGPLYVPKKEAPAASAPPASEQAADPAEDKPSDKDEADGASK
jgi:predicted small lipoprotein YifL